MKELAPWEKTQDDLIQEKNIQELAPWEKTQDIVPEEPSQLEAIARGGAQGLTFGFADELTSAAETAAKTAFGEEKLRDFLKNYQKHKEESQKEYKEAEEAHPTTYLASEIAGGILPALYTGGATAAKAGVSLGTGIARGQGVLKALAGTGVAQAAKQGAKAGAIYGGLYGLGKSEADLNKGEVGEVLSDTAKAAASGAVVGGALGAGGKVIGDKIGKLTNRLSSFIKDKFPNFVSTFKEMEEATVAGKKVIGGKRFNELYREATEMGPITDDLIEFIGKEGTKLQTESLNKVIAPVKKYNDMVDEAIAFFQNKMDLADTDIVKQDMGKMLEMFKDLKNTHSIDRLKFVPDTTTKAFNEKQATKYLQDKITLLKLQDSLNPPEKKEIGKIFDKWSKIKAQGGEKIQLVDEVDKKRVEQLLRLKDPERLDNLINDVVGLKYNIIEPEKTIPKELWGVIEKTPSYKINKMNIEGKDFVYFINNKGKPVQKEFITNVPLKQVREKVFKDIELNPQELYNFVENADALARKIKLFSLKKDGLNYGAYREATNKFMEISGQLHDDLTNTLQSVVFADGKTALDKLKNAKELRTMYHTLVETLGSAVKDTKIEQLNKNILERAAYADFFASLGRTSETAAKNRFIWEESLKMIKEVNPQKALDLQTKVEEVSKLMTLNRKFALSGFMNFGSFESMAAWSGWATGAGEKVLGIIGKTMSEATTNIAKFPPTQLASLAQKAKSPKMQRFFENLAKVENEQTKKALTFSAMQNPEFRKGLKETFGLSDENE